MEGFDKLVGDALDNSHLGLRLVLEGAKREGHGAELLAGLTEKLSRVLHLEHVRLVRPLVDGDLRVALAALTFAGGDENVDGVDLVQFEVVLVVLLALSLSRVLNDRLFTVDLVLLELLVELNVTIMRRGNNIFFRFNIETLIEIAF